MNRAPDEQPHPSPGGRLREVALIIDSMMAPRRAMMIGVARFMQEHEPWLIYLKPPFVETAIEQWLRDWRGDGVIGKLTLSDIEALRRAGIPFVEVGSYERGDGFCLVRADDRAIGELGAEHLLERGFRHFAFVELAGAFWGRSRRAGFESRLGGAALTKHQYTVEKPSARPGGPSAWAQQQNSMGQWVLQLPKPVAIMTTTDFIGRQVLEVCQRFDISVPDTVAVLGADDDEPICRISSPPLSSVIINDELRGYESARVLADLMDGRGPVEETLLVPPAGVRTRGSTDVFAFDDEHVVAAMKFLRENVERPVSIADVADATGVSRSTLDRKFRRLLRRSVNDEMVRLRLNHAIELLSQTRLPLKTIAARCCFSSQAYMGAVFRDRLGRTPRSYRR